MLIHKLKNGLEVLQIHNPNVNLITCMILVRTGSINENNNDNGISHFLEHMVFKGSKNIGNKIKLLLETNGFTYNAFTSYEYTGYYITGLPNKINTILYILGDMFYNPIFDPVEIEKEKGVIKAEIEMGLDDLDGALYRNLINMLFPKHKGIQEIAGDYTTIKKMKSNDFKKYHKKYYTPYNSLLVISGNIPSNININKYFNIKKNKSIKNPIVNVNQFSDKKKLAFIEEKNSQNNVIICLPTLGRNSLFSFLDTEVIMTIIGRGFNSKLMKILRDNKGWIYFIKTDQQQFNDNGFMTINFNCDKQYTTDAIQEVVNTFKNINIIQEELDIAKNFLLGNITQQFQTTFDYCINYGLQYILNEKILTLDDMTKYINNINLEKINSLAHLLIKPSNMYISIIGELDKKDLNNINSSIK
jgi:predicted Zn-dependent peptidase